MTGENATIRFNPTSSTPQEVQVVVQPPGREAQTYYFYIKPN